MTTTTTEARGVRALLRRRPYITHQARRTAGSWVGLAAVAIFFGIASPIFFTQANVVNLLIQSANVFLIAGGVSIVLIVGEVDLAIASIEALAGAVAAVLIVNHGWPLSLGLVAALAASVATGFISGISVAKLQIPSFVVTLAMLGIAVGAAYLLTGGNPILGFPESFGTLGNGRILGIPVAFLVAMAVLACAQWMLSRTQLGRHMYAVGGNRDAAELAGIHVGRIKATSLVICGLMSGIAGLILASRLNSGFGGNGSADLINGIAAAVIGGTSLFGGAGSMVGVIAGSLLVGSIYNGMILLDIGEYWNQVVLGIVILGATLVDQIATGTGPIGEALMIRLGKLRGGPRYDG